MVMSNLCTGDARSRFEFNRMNILVLTDKSNLRRWHFGRG